MSKYKGHMDDQTGFIAIVLLAGTLYAHKVLIEHILTYFLIALAVIAVFILGKAIYKLFKPRKLNLSDIDKMSGVEFELYVADLLRNLGYVGVRLTERYDYGIDIIARKDGITWGIQTKRYSGLVKASAVRQAVTALPVYNCDRAMVITNANYSKIAEILAKHNNCKLVGRRELLNCARY